MPKLTDTQLVILSEAAKRPDGSLLPLPNKLKLVGEALTATLGALTKKKLATAAPAIAGSAVWRKEDDQPMMLVISEAGLRAIGVTPNDTAKSSGAEDPIAPKLRSHKPRRQNVKGSSPGKGRHGASRKEVKRGPKGVRSGSKQAKVIELLRRSQGASIEEMMKVTGWQAHSVRGVMSGALKRKLGLTISTRDKRGRVYRIGGSGSKQSK